MVGLGHGLSRKIFSYGRTSQGISFIRRFVDEDFYDSQEYKILKYMISQGITPPLLEENSHYMDMLYIASYLRESWHGGSLWKTFIAQVQWLHRQDAGQFSQKTLMYRPYLETLRDYIDNFSILDAVLAKHAVCLMEGTLCHHDLGSHNLLFDPPKIYFIDWETAGYGDPLLDLAMFEIMDDLGGSRREEMLDLYGREHVCWDRYLLCREIARGLIIAFLRQRGCMDCLLYERVSKACPF